jgi:folate-binding protein YgfZ
LLGIEHDPKRLDFLWVVDFPLLAWSEEERKWNAVHHPFTRPKAEDVALLDAEKFGEVRAEAYDIVLNGVELGSGSIRIHDAEVQRRVFRFLGIGDAEDFDFDRDYPIELNFDLVGGIDFAKGCFVGQETTSRMKRRGQVRTRLLPLRFEGPPPPRGSEVLRSELRAGEVRSGVDGLALALLRLDRLDGDLTVDGRPVRVDPTSGVEP